MDIKTAYIVGMSKSFVDNGLLPNLPFQKVAQGAEIAAQATPDESQMIGQSITPQDLESLMKILEVLSILFEQYQQQAGGAMPPGAMPPGAMPPPPPGAMPPGAMPPGAMPPPPPGAMPPGAMPPQ